MEEMLRQILEQLDSMDKRLDIMENRLELIESEIGVLGKKHESIRSCTSYVTKYLDGVVYEIHTANK